MSEKARKWRRSDITDLDVVRATHERIGSEFITEELALMFPGCPAKVLYAAMERAEKNGLLECGVSLRSGWLTEAGRNLLEAA